jgi:hypothetical protein
MANFIAVSPSQTTSGGNSGDLFVFRSAAQSGATVIGGTGSDTLEFNEPAASADKVSVSLAGGADVFLLSAVQLSGNLRGGAGADTITISGASNISNVALGAGSDLLNVRGALTQLGGSVIQGGKGADTITGNNQANALSGASVLLGAGKDSLTLSATIQSGLIVGGGGADVINLDVLDNAANSTIKGGAGGDTLTLGGNVGSGNVLLGNGSDVMQFSGTYSFSGQVLGGQGADRISGAGDVFANATGVSIGGGAGADTISLSEFGSAGQGAFVIGGGGNDSININGNASNNFSAGGGMSAGQQGRFSAGAGFGTIVGGAGADSITFLGNVDNTAGFAGIIAFSALTDSTQASMDVVTYDASAGVEKLIALDFAGTIATAVGSGAAKGSLSTNGDGFLASAGDNSSVAERISAIDSLLATGEIGTFKDVSGNAYVFVQGGATDFVAKFQGADTSAGTVALSADGAGFFRLGIND